MPSTAGGAGCERATGSEIMPRLSVLLPVKDGQRTIAAAVTSTLVAMPSDSELLVLDDASVDRTAAIVDAIDDPRVRLVRSETPLGVARGLNRLLDLSDSALVARMDADDLTLPGRFSAQARALRATKAEILFSTVVEFSERPRRVRPHLPLSIAPDAFALHLLLTNPVSHPTLFATRRALVETGGYRAVPAEDYELWLRAAADGRRLARSARPALAYRIHAAQVTASGAWRRTSWDDATTAAEFSRLAEAELGRPARRLSSLAVDARLDDEEFDALVAAFGADVTAASRALGSRRSTWLRRLLDKRVAAARAARQRDRAAREATPNPD